MGFDDPNDPEAPTTEHGRAFPYQTLPQPSNAVLKTIALPDPGSVRFVNHVVAGAPPGGSSGPSGLSKDEAVKRRSPMHSGCRQTPDRGCSRSRASCPTRC